MLHPQAEHQLICWLTIIHKQTVFRHAVQCDCRRARKAQKELHKCPGNDSLAAKFFAMAKSWMPLVMRLRKIRKIHRLTGLVLAVFLLIIAASGIFLAWKKQSDTIQPPTQQGVDTCKQWLPLEKIEEFARQAASRQLQAPKIDRIDFRPGKGVAKVRFEQKNHEVQVDACSGEVLSVARRHSDWIESLHDGSIVSNAFKLLIMSITGVGLMLMVITGWMLWLGPKRIKAKKKSLPGRSGKKHENE